MINNNVEQNNTEKKELEISNIYLAGSLFNKAEVNERIREGKLIKESLPLVKVYNPIEEPINDKAKLPTAEDIFLGDYKAVLKSDCIIADITNNDVGVAMELGIAVVLNDVVKIIEDTLNTHNKDQKTKDIILNNLKDEGIKKRRILAHNSDIRVGTSGNYDGNYVPYGQNQFLIGGIEYLGDTVKKSIEDIITELKEESKK